MGNSVSHQNTHKKPVVLIVGGGYGGVQCAKALDKCGKFFLVLIDRKSYFLHNVASLRASVDREYAPQILIPYDRLLTKECIIQAEVLSISEHSIQVHGRDEPIQFDYLIIATGSSYAFPGKVADPRSSQALARYHILEEKIERAQRILVIGGGPVGIELCGEIATDFPSKVITLVHSGTVLLGSDVFHEHMYTRLREQLEKLGVKIIFNDRIEFESAKNILSAQELNYIEGEQTFCTENSKKIITADLTFICTGAQVNNKSIKMGPLASKLNADDGRLNVNGYLQVEGYTNIFAIGDISGKEAKLAFLAAKQADYVASIIPLIEQGKHYPDVYRPLQNQLMIVTVGRNGGVGQLPIKNGSIVVGSTIVKLIKSTNLFTSRYWKMMNQKHQPTSSIFTEVALNDSVYLEKLNALKQSMEMTEEEARELLSGLAAKALEPGQDFI